MELPCVSGTTGANTGPNGIIQTTKARGVFLTWLFLAVYSNTVQGDLVSEIGHLGPQMD